MKQVCLLTAGPRYVILNSIPLITLPYLHYFFIGSFLFEDGELYRERRRFGLAAFKNLGVGKKSLEHRLNEEARHLCKVFEQQDNAFDPIPLVGNAISNIICAICFGQRFDYSDPAFNDLLSRLRENATLISFISPANFLPSLYHTSYYAKHRENVATTKAFIEGIVEEHKKTFDRSDLRDIIDMYIDEIKRQKEEGSKVVFSDASMWRSIFDLFGAGSDTTTNTLIWGLMFLCYDPSIQTKVCIGK